MGRKTIINIKINVLKLRILFLFQTQFKTIYVTLQFRKTLF